MDLGERVLPRELTSTGPILITGHIKTSKCGKVVWGAGAQPVFSMPVDVGADAQSKAGFRMTIDHIENAVQIITLPTTASDAGVTDEPATADQCIFINYYEVKRGRFLTHTIKASAGPSGLGDFDRKSPDCVRFIVSEDKVRTNASDLPFIVGV